MTWFFLTFNYNFFMLPFYVFRRKNLNLFVLFKIWIPDPYDFVFRIQMIWIRNAVKCINLQTFPGRRKEENVAKELVGVLGW